jgi:type I restriction enzyme M protein
MELSLSIYVVQTPQFVFFAFQHIIHGLLEDLKYIMNNFKEKANLIWGIADLLRGEYKQADYGKVILPLVVLKRLDEVLAPTKEKVLNQFAQVQSIKVDNIDPILNRVAGLNFHNKSKYDFQKLLADPDNLAEDLKNYIAGFSSTARDIIEHFQFDREITTVDKANLLYLVIKEMNTVDLHPSKVSSMEMGYIFEELIRKFAEASNETAGEHFTPREVIRLMVNLLFVDDKEILTKRGIVKTLYDPACGTGGMLSIAEEYLHELNPDAQLELFGQELNPESYAICKSDMLIKGQNANHIKLGNSFTNDQLENDKFDYMLSNPPFGVEWKKVEKEIKKEHEQKGKSGRFAVGLPRISDGSFLFLQHMISKMKLSNGGARIGIVFNGSPLFTGGTGSGESEIRRWIIENDWLDAIIAMPTELFYNTGIATYIWIVTNRKDEKRKGKVQLINAVSFYKKMAKSLGNKRNEISNEQIKKITQLYDDFKDGEYTKIFANEDFGYWQVTVERPLKDVKGNIELDKKSNPKADTSLRETESIPLNENIEEYFKREVLPHEPDAWMDRSKDKKGYEINFTKYFYKFQPLRSLEEIRKDILKLEEESEGLLTEIIK